MGMACDYDCTRCRNRCSAEDGTPFCGITLVWIDGTKGYCANFKPAVA